MLIEFILYVFLLIDIQNCDSTAQIESISYDENFDDFKLFGGKILKLGRRLIWKFPLMQNIPTSNSLSRPSRKYYFENPNTNVLDTTEFHEHVDIERRKNINSNKIDIQQSELVKPRTRRRRSISRSEQKQPLVEDSVETAPRTNEIKSSDTHTNIDENQRNPYFKSLFHRVFPINNVIRTNGKDFKRSLSKKDTAEFLQNRNDQPDNSNENGIFFKNSKASEISKHELPELFEYINNNLNYINEGKLPIIINRTISSNRKKNQSSNGSAGLEKAGMSIDGKETKSNQKLKDRARLKNSVPKKKKKMKLMLVIDDSETAENLSQPDDIESSPIHNQSSNKIHNTSEGFNNKVEAGENFDTEKIMKGESADNTLETNGRQIDLPQSSIESKLYTGVVYGAIERTINKESSKSSLELNEPNTNLSLVTFRNEIHPNETGEEEKILKDTVSSLEMNAQHTDLSTFSTGNKTHSSSEYDSRVRIMENEHTDNTIKPIGHRSNFSLVTTRNDIDAKNEYDDRYRKMNDGYGLNVMEQNDDQTSISSVFSLHGKEENKEYDRIKKQEPVDSLPEQKDEHKQFSHITEQRKEDQSDVSKGEVRNEINAYDENDMGAKVMKTTKVKSSENLPEIEYSTATPQNEGKTGDIIEDRNETLENILNKSLVSLSHRDSKQTNSPLFEIKNNEDMADIPDNIAQFSNMTLNQTSRNSLVKDEEEKKLSIVSSRPKENTSDTVQDKTETSEKIFVESHENSLHQDAEKVLDGSPVGPIKQIDAQTESSVIGIQNEVNMTEGGAQFSNKLLDENYISSSAKNEERAGFSSVTPQNREKDNYTVEDRTDTKISELVEEKAGTLEEVLVKSPVNSPYKYIEEKELDGSSVSSAKQIDTQRNSSLVSFENGDIPEGRARLSDKMDNTSISSWVKNNPETKFSSVTFRNDEKASHMVEDRAENFKKVSVESPENSPYQDIEEKESDSLGSTNQTDAQTDYYLANTQNKEYLNDIPEDRARLSNKMLDKTSVNSSVQNKKKTKLSSVTLRNEEENSDKVEDRPENLDEILVESPENLLYRDVEEKELDESSLNSAKQDGAQKNFSLVNIKKEKNLTDIQESNVEILHKTIPKANASLSEQNGEEMKYSSVTSQNERNASDSEEERAKSLKTILVKYPENSPYQNLEEKELDISSVSSAKQIDIPGDESQFSNNKLDEISISSLVKNEGEKKITIVPYHNEEKARERAEISGTILAKSSENSLYQDIQDKGLDRSSVNSERQIDTKTNSTLVNIQNEDDLIDIQKSRADISNEMLHETASLSGQNEEGTKFSSVTSRTDDKTNDFVDDRAETFEKILVQLSESSPYQDVEKKEPDGSSMSSVKKFDAQKNNSLVKMQNKEDLTDKPEDGLQFSNKKINENFASSSVENEKGKILSFDTSQNEGKNSDRVENKAESSEKISVESHGNSIYRYVEEKKLEESSVSSAQVDAETNSTLVHSQNAVDMTDIPKRRAEISNVIHENSSLSKQNWEETKYPSVTSRNEQKFNDIVEDRVENSQKLLIKFPDSSPYQDVEEKEKVKMQNKENLIDTPESGSTLSNKMSVQNERDTKFSSVISRNERRNSDRVEDTLEQKSVESHENSIYRDVIETKLAESPVSSAKQTDSESNSTLVHIQNTDDFTKIPKNIAEISNETTSLSKQNENEAKFSLVTSGNGEKNNDLVGDRVETLEKLLVKSPASSPYRDVEEKEVEGSSVSSSKQIHAEANSTLVDIQNKDDLTDKPRNSAEIPKEVLHETASLSEINEEETKFSPATSRNEGRTNDMEEERAETLKETLVKFPESLPYHDVERKKLDGSSISSSNQINAQINYPSVNMLTKEYLINIPEGGSQSLNGMSDKNTVSSSVENEKDKKLSSVTSRNEARNSDRVEDRAEALGKTSVESHGNSIYRDVEEKKLDESSVSSANKIDAEIDSTLVHIQNADDLADIPKNIAEISNEKHKTAGLSEQNENETKFSLETSRNEEKTSDMIKDRAKSMEKILVEFPASLYYPDVEEKESEGSSVSSANQIDAETNSTLIDIQNNDLTYIPRNSAEISNEALNKIANLSEINKKGTKFSSLSSRNEEKISDIVEDRVENSEKILVKFPNSLPYQDVEEKESNRSAESSVKQIDSQTNYSLVNMLTKEYLTDIPKGGSQLSNETKFPSVISRKEEKISDILEDKVKNSKNILVKFPDSLQHQDVEEKESGGSAVSSANQIDGQTNYSSVNMQTKEYVTDIREGGSQLSNEMLDKTKFPSVISRNEKKIRDILDDRVENSEKILVKFPNSLPYQDVEEKESNRSAESSVKQIDSQTNYSLVNMLTKEYLTDISEGGSQLPNETKFPSVISRNEKKISDIVEDRAEKSKKLLVKFPDSLPYQDVEEKESNRSAESSVKPIDSQTNYSLVNMQTKEYVTEIQEGGSQLSNEMLDKTKFPSVISKNEKKISDIVEDRVENSKKLLVKFPNSLPYQDVEEKESNRSAESSVKQIDSQTNYSLVNMLTKEYLTDIPEGGSQLSNETKFPSVISRKEGKISDILEDKVKHSKNILIKFPDSLRHQDVEEKESDGSAVSSANQIDGQTNYSLVNMQTKEYVTDIREGGSQLSNEMLDKTKFPSVISRNEKKISDIVEDRVENSKNLLIKFSDSLPYQDVEEKESDGSALNSVEQFDEQTNYSSVSMLTKKYLTDIPEGGSQLSKEKLDKTKFPSVISRNEEKISDIVEDRVENSKKSLVKFPDGLPYQDVEQKESERSAERSEKETDAQTNYSLVNIHSKEYPTDIPSVVSRNEEKNSDIVEDRVENLEKLLINFPESLPYQDVDEKESNGSAVSSVKQIDAQTNFSSVNMQTKEYFTDIPEGGSQLSNKMLDKTEFPSAISRNEEKLNDIVEDRVENSKKLLVKFPESLPYQDVEEKESDRSAESAAKQFDAQTNYSSLNMQTKEYLTDIPEGGSQSTNETKFPSVISRNEEKLSDIVEDRVENLEKLLINFPESLPYQDVEEKESDGSAVSSVKQIDEQTNFSSLNMQTKEYFTDIPEGGSQLSNKMLDKTEFPSAISRNQEKLNDIVEDRVENSKKLLEKFSKSLPYQDVEEKESDRSAESSAKQFDAQTNYSSVNMQTKEYLTDIPEGGSQSTNETKFPSVISRNEEKLSDIVEDRVENSKKLLVKFPDSLRYQDVEEKESDGSAVSSVKQFDAQTNYSSVNMQTKEYLTDIPEGGSQLSNAMLVETKFPSVISRNEKEMSDLVEGKVENSEKLLVKLPDSLLYQDVKEKKSDGSAVSSVKPIDARTNYSLVNMQTKEYLTGIPEGRSQLLNEMLDKTKFPPVISKNEEKISDIVEDRVENSEKLLVKFPDSLRYQDVEEKESDGYAVNSLKQINEQTNYTTVNMQTKEFEHADEFPSGEQLGVQTNLSHVNMQNKEDMSNIAEDRAVFSNDVSKGNHERTKFSLIFSQNEGKHSQIIEGIPKSWTNMLDKSTINSPYSDSEQKEFKHADGSFVSSTKPFGNQTNFSQVNIQDNEYMNNISRIEKNMLKNVNDFTSYKKSNNFKEMKATGSSEGLSEHIYDRYSLKKVSEEVPFEFGKSHGKSLLKKVWNNPSNNPAINIIFRVGNIKRKAGNGQKLKNELNIQLNIGDIEF